MRFQLRRNIHETSSSSASTFTMISNKGVRTPVKLDKPWICVQSGFCTSGDGIPHEYLTRWQEKMAFLASDSPSWKDMFRRVTGQSFKLYMLVTADWRSTTSQSMALGIPGSIPIELDEETGIATVPELGYMCGYNLGHCDWLIAIPVETKPQVLSDYDLVFVFTDAESLVGLPELQEQFGEDELDDRLLEEIIFNPALAFDIGGDAFMRDNSCGVVNGFLSDGDKNSPLSYAGYAAFDQVYHNGNETLILGIDGSKIRICKDEIDLPEYPDSIDLKITDCCYNNCPFCYENCTPDGKNGDIPDELFSQIPPFTEIAVGGGNALLHPEIFQLRERYQLRMNLTLYAQDFLNDCWHSNYDYTGESALHIFDAVGVSITSAEAAQQLADFVDSTEEKWDLRDALEEYRDLHELWENCSQLVVHAVNGIITEEMLAPLYDKNLRLLVLGYKTKGRGMEYSLNEEVAANQKWLYDNIEEVAKHFLVTAFDTLALEQLDIRRLVSDEDWRHLYMGDDGTHSMYIDLVKKEYGISSTDSRRWPLTNDLKQMFKNVREIVAQDKKE